ncbi:MAG: MBL fold metallo-hydrolase [Chloroflexi bacterium]|nr:MBL fold metallo-hydrolase [Chloroflexota bacterium]MDA1145219.1 MBL fold metallo-hydrolase [Chloroflexota bacterium]
MPYRPMPEYQTGPVELGDNLYAYMQWNGGWGISNAGFLVDDDGILVIDALMAPSMTRKFVRAMREVSTAPFRHLVNTHMHADHTNGNQFIEGAEIVANEHCREEMQAAEVFAAAQAAKRAPGDRGAKPFWIQESWWDELAEVKSTLPVTTFSDRLTLHYGDTEAQLSHHGPAHTLGDSLVYFPDSKTLFSGDLCFFYATPLSRGHMPNWVEVCKIIGGMDIDRVIPGHGPIGGKQELQDMQEYLEFMVAQTRDAFENGLSEADAAKSIDIGQWAQWPEAERKEMNIANLYATFAAERAGTS